MRPALRCTQIPSDRQTQTRYSAPELLRPPHRASGEMYWYAGKTSSISSSSKSQRGFPCNTIRHIYSTRARAHPLFKQAFWIRIKHLNKKRGEKKRLHHADQHLEINRGQKWSLANHMMLLFRFWWITLFRAGGRPLRPLGPASSAACQPVRLLKRYLNVRLQQCAHSMTSLFVKIDYFK